MTISTGLTRGSLESFRVEEFLGQEYIRAVSMMPMMQTEQEFQTSVFIGMR